MGNKYTVNYRLIFTVLSVIYVFALFVIAFISKSIAVCITMTVIIIILEIYALFGPQRIKSVTVNTAKIIIEYRKVKVNPAYIDCEKIEHYTHGPFTERIRIYSKGYVYEILFDLKDFHNMCGNIYAKLVKNNMQHIADSWFQSAFGEGSKTV